MLIFTFATSCLTISNMPWFTDLTSQVPMHIAPYSIGLYFHQQSHPQLGVVFALAPSLHSFWGYSSSILGTSRPGEFILQCPTLLPWTLFPWPVISIAGHCFHFGSISSFFLKLFLHSSPVTYWAPTNLGSSSFSVLSFCLFILSMGFPRQEYWSDLPFSSPVDHVLSELSTMMHPSWVAPHGKAPSFIGLNKIVVLVISLTSFLWLWFSFCLPSEG